MNKQNEKTKETQGVESKERKDSFTYTIKSVKTLIEKLERNKWASEDEVTELKKIHKKMIEKYIGLDMYD